MAGFWGTILRRNPHPLTVFQPRSTILGGRDEQVLWYNGVNHATPDSLWRTQPHLRTVVSFLARNVAQLGLHSFERVGEVDRRRDRSSASARALAAPDVNMTTFELIYALVGDLCLYDRAYWFVGPSSATSTGVALRRLPPSWVSPVMKDPYTVQHYSVSLDGKAQVDVPPESVLPFTGYSPSSPSGGSPTVESLKDTLREQVESARYRESVWKRGGRVSAVLERPVGAPRWSEAARESFREDWYAKYTGRGSKVGGTPLLEDGMTLRRIDYSAQEQQYVEAAKLSLVTVAAAFHVNPTMIGQNDGANYSNVREFRRMLYGDTLGPLLAQIEARINAFLLPMLGVDQERHYVEFNIAEKLQGSFEEQTAALSSSVGRPWMTADEARARLNLPSLGGDAAGLVTPLNVLVGGQASPRDSGSQNRNAAPAPRVKARAPETYEQKAAQVLGRFFKRQERVVRSALGAKAAGEWWDGERWDGELAADLYRLALSVTQQVAAGVLDGIGFSPDAYDVDRTAAWLDEAMTRSATSINATTRERIEAALSADSEGDEDPLDAVFDAQESRADEGAVSLVTTLSGFATVEAAKQVGDDKVVKTWVVNSSNPRSSHAALDGETVPVSEKFSSGQQWPGDGGDPAEVAGCRCSVVVHIP